MKYQEINAKMIDAWCENGWEWGKVITHEEYEKALNGEWKVRLTPTKYVPHEWFGELQGKQVLGLASGGGQQIPIFSALGAECTLLDYSAKQCESEGMVAKREGYKVNVIQADMSQRLPFDDSSFDLIFHPVSNCYVEEVKPIFKECFRVLKKGGILLCGLDNGFAYIFDETGSNIKYKLPFNPLKDSKVYEDSIKNDWGIAFSHTLEEQIGGQLEAGIVATDLIEVGRISDRSRHSVYAEFLCVTDWDKDKIQLQEGETVAYRWVSASELRSMSKEELVTHRMQPFIEELKQVMN